MSLSVGPPGVGNAGPGRGVTEGPGGTTGFTDDGRDIGKYISKKKRQGAK